MYVCMFVLEMDSYLRTWLAQISGNVRVCMYVRVCVLQKHSTLNWLQASLGGCWRKEHCIPLPQPREPARTRTHTTQTCFRHARRLQTHISADADFITKACAIGRIQAHTNTHPTPLMFISRVCVCVCLHLHEWHYGSISAWAKGRKNYRELVRYSHRTDPLYSSG